MVHGKKLPCSLVPENGPRLEKRLKSFFDRSVFNVCERQNLPLMDGSCHPPPFEIHIDTEVRPLAISRSSPVPDHGLDKFKTDLDWHLGLGEIERVSANTPVTWCSRMHMVQKKDGSCRRIMDLCHLNVATAKQSTTFITPSSWVR